jgi:hypothetical protein
MTHPTPLLRLSNRARRAIIALAATIVVGAPPLEAKEGPLVGVWSTIIPGTGGVPVEISFGFGADGRLQQQVTAAGNETFYSGVYSLAANGTLTYRIDDYVPKTRCAGSVCVLVPPAMPLGDVLTARIDAAGADSFIFIEAKETHIFRRQR